MTTPGHTFTGECLSRIYAQLDAANAARASGDVPALTAALDAIERHANAALLHVNPVRPSGTVTHMPPRLRSVRG